MDAEDAALACGHGQRRSQLTAAAQAHHVRREGPRRVDHCARAKRLLMPTCAAHAGRAYPHATLLRRDLETLDVGADEVDAEMRRLGAQRREERPRVEPALGVLAWLGFG